MHTKAKQRRTRIFGCKEQKYYLILQQQRKIDRAHRIAIIAIVAILKNQVDHSRKNIGITNSNYFKRKDDSQTNK